jgi:hypothetical protein
MNGKISNIKKLQDAIQELHGLASKHSATAKVTETFQGEVVWDGYVEVFLVAGNPIIRRAYAWSHDTDDGGERFVVVLEKPPVNSPETAVRAAIMAEIKSAREEIEKGGAA